MLRVLWGPVARPQQTHPWHPVQLEAPAGSIQIAQNGAIRLLAAPSGYLAGDELSFWSSATEKGFMYDGVDVLAIAVMDKTSYETIAGISGTAATGVPIASSTNYDGSFAATYFRSGGINAPWNAYGTFTTTVDFGSGTIIGVGSGDFESILFVSGSLTGTEFSGAAQFSGLEYTGAASVPVSGGLYGPGAATVAGIYQGDAVTGVFWGQ